MQSDVKEFYPSITEKSLSKPINLEEDYTSFSHENIWIITCRRKSLLFYNDESCKKKEPGSSVDLITGS